MENVVERIKAKTGFIIDMDGVIYHGNMLLPGVTEFLAWLENSGKNIPAVLRKVSIRGEISEETVNV